MNAQEQYPNLSQLLSSYFHQDFDLDSGSPEQCIAQFLQVNTVDNVKECINELVMLINSSQKDKELAQKFAELGSFCSAEVDWPSYQQWAIYLKSDLEKALVEK
jgi:hypothetical protein